MDTENNKQVSTESETIAKDVVLSAVVRTFFKYFTLGIVEGRSADSNDMSAYEPKNIKQLVVDYFDKISAVFNQEAFYAFARMNYLEEEIEKELNIYKETVDELTAMSLVRFACRNDDFYDTMVSEYKRNFEYLLCGVFSVSREQAQQYTRCKTLGTMKLAMAESIINNIAHSAYSEGKKLSMK